MSAASSGFRSHLMQQFAAAARNQARPPLALVGLSSSSEQRRRRTSSSSATTASSSAARRYLERQESSRRRRSNPVVFHAPSSRWLSSSSSSSAASSPDARLELQEEEEETSRHEDDSANQDGNTAQEEGLSAAARSFQQILQTRRTSGRLVSCSNKTEQERFGGGVDPRSFFQAALDRAVQCGLAAPNHKRTEPFCFRRILSPSPATDRLAEIAFQVRLLQQHGNSNDDTATTVAAAERKREKWSQIPAFLVAMVKQQQLGSNTSTSTETSSLSTNPDYAYTPLPYTAPQDERQLEDYAAACAAVQNVLLSLHAEDLASKWATGPVIRTPAFRELVQAEPEDRIVALVMVGAGSSSKRRPLKPLPRRQTWDEALVDL